MYQCMNVSVLKVTESNTNINVFDRLYALLFFLLAAIIKIIIPSQYITRINVLDVSIML